MSEITVEQLGELIAQAKSGRITREFLQAFLQNPQSVVNAKLREEYVVFLDYGKSVEEMVSAGQYKRKNSDINSKNFPTKGEGTANVNLELVHFGKSVSSEYVLVYLKENGMRPATVEELLAFGATYPKIQREFPIICLGSSWVDSDGTRSVPYLDGRGSERDLNLCWLDVDWLASCRFLAAVRK